MVYVAGSWYNGGASYPIQQRNTVAAPTISQIPGLGQMSQEGGSQSGIRRGVVSDGDSDYIKLAKRGGRSDLLHAEPEAQQRSAEAPTTGGKRMLAPRTKADWYYDNSDMAPPPQHTKSAANVPATE